MGRVFEKFNIRNAITVTAAHTLTALQNAVFAGGSSDYTITLYDMFATLRGTTGGGHYIENNGTALVTLAAATNETINGYATLVLKPGQRVILGADKRQRNWIVSAPDWMPLDVATQERSITVPTDGTTAVNVFGPSGAPRDLYIEDIVFTSLDTTAGNIVLKIGASTVNTTAKGTTAGVRLGAVALANRAANQGDAVTLESSSAGNVRATITYTVAAAQSTP